MSQAKWLFLYSWLIIIYVGGKQKKSICTLERKNTSQWTTRRSYLWPCTRSTANWSKTQCSTARISTQFQSWVDCKATREKTTQISSSSVTALARSKAESTWQEAKCLLSPRASTSKLTLTATILWSSNPDSQTAKKSSTSKWSSPSATSTQFPNTFLMSFWALWSEEEAD